MLVVDQIERRFVTPFYLDVLHGNLVALASSVSRQDEIIRQMWAVAGEVTLDAAIDLWSRGWRQALMASWWAAVWQWPETADLDYDQPWAAAALTQPACSRTRSTNEQETQ